MLLRTEKTCVNQCPCPENWNEYFFIYFSLIFELYHDVLTVYHKDSLVKFPQHSALALTNCLYLAHQCRALSLEFQGDTLLTMHRQLGQLRSKTFSSYTLLFVQSTFRPR